MHFLIKNSAMYYVNIAVSEAYLIDALFYTCNIPTSQYFHISLVLVLAFNILASMPSIQLP